MAYENKYNSTKMVGNGLEEAAEEYTQKMLESWRFDSTGCRPPRESFKAGAEWQKNQMLKDAVECELVCIKERLAAILPMKEFQWTVGDKVRIVVLKAEEE